MNLPRYLPLLTIISLLIVACTSGERSAGETTQLATTAADTFAIAPTRLPPATEPSEAPATRSRAYPDTNSAAAFDRKVDDQTLTFAPVDGGGYEIKDKETGTLWNALTGRAIEGPLLNKSLDKLPFTPAFWFGWKDNYPDTLVYGERR